MENNYLSITQINNYIKNIFEAEILLQNVCVYGEVSSFNVTNNIAYFNLKDENSILPCMLFQASKFNTPKIGDVILATGSMNYYTKGGRLSFNANYIAPYGKGMLYENFLQLKAKLDALGYFNSSIKKPLPKRVNKIGVVTSATGAVIHDIIHVATRRNNQVNIVLFPVRVQGVGAEQEIAKGINYFSNDKSVDCIIVARGGGSLEDLQPFNTEVLATAVFECKKPLVSAVGHETDVTIIDFCSDLRAPTPSAAAELVVGNKSDDYLAVYNAMASLGNRVTKCILSYENKLDSNMSNLNRNMDYCIKNAKSKLAIAFEALYYSVNNKISSYEFKINNNLISLEKSNPNYLLEKGYTKIMLAGTILKDINKIKINDEVSFRLKNGGVVSKVINVEGK